MSAVYEQTQVCSEFCNLCFNSFSRIITLNTLYLSLFEKKDVNNNTYGFNPRLYVY